MGSRDSSFTVLLIALLQDLGIRYPLESSPEWYDQTYLLGFLIVNSLFVWM